MIIRGKDIARRMRDELEGYVSRLNKNPVLAIIVVGHDPVIERFVGIKRVFAKYVGIEMREYRFSNDDTMERIQNQVRELAQETTVDAIVVQLPLPSHIRRNELLQEIPIEKDVDVISPGAIAVHEAGSPLFLPPVVGAMKKILEEYEIEVRNKNVVVVGKGALVGAPAGVWFKDSGAHVTMCDKESFSETTCHNADIITLGAGVPGLLKPEMISEGVVILDAGTSEEAGRLAGDADPQCAEKASLFTPVPGGIGPITVAVLFKNVVQAAQQK